MDEDILSDIVPSNIVSRQVCVTLPIGTYTYGTTQPSQGADGESEFDDEAMDEDELMSESEDKGVCWLLFSTGCAIY